MTWPPPESRTNPFSMCNLNLGGDGDQEGEGEGGSEGVASRRGAARAKSGKASKKQRKALREGARSTCKGIHKYMSQCVSSDHGSFYLEAGKTEKHHEFFWGDSLKNFLEKHNPLLPKE